MIRELNLKKAAGVVAAISIASLAAAQKPGPLHLGDPAPALNIADWIKGEPVAKIAKNQVYVVEFWATWCGPCRQAIPHLTQLAHKYGKDAVFVGVDAFEKNDGETAQPKTNAFLSKVAKFVKSEGASMDYHVGADDRRGVMAATWMDAAGQAGIPTAFIVDRDSRVVWIGSPMEIETPLSQVVKGTYDLNAAKDHAGQAASREAAHRKEFAALIQAEKDKDFPKIVSECDRLWPLYPQERQNLFFEASRALDATSSTAFADYLKKTVANSQEDGKMLWTIAWELVDPRFKTRIKDHDYPLAIACVQRAKQLSTVPDWNLEAILTEAYYCNRQTDDGKKSEELCLSLMSKAPEVTPDEIKQLKTWFKQCQETGSR